jgi:hypothetical protein
MKTQIASRYSADQLATIRDAIVAIANNHNAAYPQYAGHWDGSEWYAVRIVKDVKTKLGLAFQAGEVTIARADRGDGYAHPKGWTFLTAYSVRNKIDTSIRTEYARPL